MKLPVRPGALAKRIRGWLPNDRATSGPRLPSGRRWRLASWQFLSFFVLEFCAIFIVLSVVQLAGWVAYSGYAAGATGSVAAIAGSLLFLRSVNASGLYAQLGDLEIQSQFLRHVVDWLGGLVIEGTASGPDRQVLQDKLATFRKGDAISYVLTTDGGKAIAGSALVKGVATKAKSDGRLLFTITMRRERG